MRFNSRLKITIAVCASLCLLSCNSQEQEVNSLSAAEQEAGWALLFDGKTFNNWHLYNGGDTTSAWVIQNGVLYCDPNSEASKWDLVTDKTYKNYELTFDWKLEKEGNSGVFINVLEQKDILATYHSGPEYQLLEDSHVDFEVPSKKSGCLYTFLPQKNLTDTKLFGEWNRSKIVQKEGLIQFYLNDNLTAEMDLKSEKWKNMVKVSKFKDHAEFGKRTEGKIALQDWSRGSSFRNIKIKEM